MNSKSWTRPPMNASPLKTSDGDTFRARMKLKLNQAALSITLFEAMHSIRSFQDLTNDAAPSSRS